MKANPMDDKLTPQRGTVKFENGSTDFIAKDWKPTPVQIDEALDTASVTIGLHYVHGIKPEQRVDVLLALVLEHFQRELTEAKARCEALERALNPRIWSQALNKAWHLNLPDAVYAFRCLRDAAIAEMLVSNYVDKKE